MNDVSAGHAGRLLASKQGFDILDCEVCGFAHVVPMPNVEELASLYKHEFYGRDKPFYFEQYEEDSDWWSEVYKERLEYLSYLKDPSSLSLVDIGSGPGLFLKVAETMGFQSAGIEPSDMAVEYSRGKGLTVYSGLLDEDAVSLVGQCDLVHMSAVLEHVPDAKRTLELVFQMLHENGQVCVVVPNDFNELQKILRDFEGYESWWVAPPHHLNYFTFDSLDYLMKSVGFEIIKRTTTFPMEWFLLSGDNYVDNPELGRVCHSRRKRFELALANAGQRELKAEIYSNLAELGLGREIVIYARKPA